MLLNLPSIKVVKTDENDHDYHVYAIAIEIPHQCPECNWGYFYGHGSKEHLVMDTPIHGKREGLFDQYPVFKFDILKKCLL